MMFGTIGLGFGWLMMLLMVGLPILGVILILLAAAGFFQNRSFTVAPVRNDQQANQTMNGSFNASSARCCAHCGAGLQPGWTHCPQCGAPVQ